VVHGRIGACDVAKELETGGADAAGYCHYDCLSHATGSSGDGIGNREALATHDVSWRQSLMAQLSF